MSPEIRQLFEVELRNERYGGALPATVNSARESIEQAPDDVIKAWCSGDREGLLLELSRFPGAALLVDLL